MENFNNGGNKCIDSIVMEKEKNIPFFLRTVEVFLFFLYLDCLILKKKNSFLMLFCELMLIVTDNC